MTMSSATTHPCETVAEGGVGESGASALLHHQHCGDTPKMVVLRTTESSLCTNTGAIAALVVNGEPAATANITPVGATVETEAAPGDHVVAVVHTIPLFNDIVCVRLGELEFGLDLCDLGDCTAAPTTKMACVISCAGFESRGWYAWNNKMPPPPDDLHIVGEVDVPNPGVDIELVPKAPQGINPAILLIDLIATQRAGIWPQVITPKQVRYDRVLVGSEYESVTVFCGDAIVAQIPVQDVH